MLEIIIAVITGWLAFITESPSTDSFSSFIVFFFLWIVYFAIGRFIVGIVFKRPNIFVDKPTPQIIFDKSPKDVMKSIFGSYVYPDKRIELANREIKKNLLSIAVQHKNIDFIHLWLLYEDSQLGHIMCDVASSAADPELQNRINFIIHATIIKFEKDNPQIDGHFLYE